MPDDLVGTFLFWCMMALPLGPTVLTCMLHAAISPDLRWILAPIGSIVASFLLSTVVIASWSVARSLLASAVNVIGITGGLYLIWLGCRLISQLNRAAYASTNPLSADAKTTGNPFRDGFWVSISNPKVLVVYATVLGPKLDTLGPFNARSWLEIITMLFAALTVYCTYGLGAHVASRTVPRAHIISLSRGIGGAAFCIVGFSIFADAATSIYHRSSLSS